METSDCAAAVDPTSFHNRGADELERFLTGARSRSETALLITTIGDAADDTPRSVFAEFDDRVMLPGFLRESIDGRRLPTGAQLTPATDLEPADHDLAKRLLNRPVDAPWWALTLRGQAMTDGAGPVHYDEPRGELCPILIDPLGEPVVAAWVSPEGDQRWYVLPDATDWNAVLDWLVTRALPVYVPDALRRARSIHLVDPDLQTSAEKSARQALADLEATYAEDKGRLQAELRLAEAKAEPIRYGLLYGTGGQLVSAVHAVLTEAGFTTVNLDDEIGDTKSADLLAALDQDRRLVEVKSAGGNAKEGLVDDLKRHLTTWPQLRPDEPVGGGALIVNHQHRLVPRERSAHVYRRPEFVRSLTIPVVSTRKLFDWWRMSDWAAIRTAVLGMSPGGSAIHS